MSIPSSPRFLQRDPVFAWGVSMADKPPPPEGKKPRRKRAKRPALGKRKTSPQAKSKKRGRRIRIKLGLKQSKIKREEDSYEDQVGWTVNQQILDPYEDLEAQEPDAVTHQCSMCGSIMQIPQPKRERYKVICAYSECGHEDMIGG